VLYLRAKIHIPGWLISSVHLRDVGDGWSKRDKTVNVDIGLRATACRRVGLLVMSQQEADLTTRQCDRKEIRGAANFVG
jgi:hypothetical protein